MTTSTDDHPATVDEIYQSASNTSNLRVEADRRGPGDVIIAAGWSMSRLGMGLLRLHSEWDASEKPPKPTKASIEALVGTFQRALPGEYAPVLAGNKPRPLTGAEAVHHLLRGGQRMGHMWAIGLCEPGHHQNGQPLGMTSRHPWRTRFEREFGTELDLLNYLIRELSWTNHPATILIAGDVAIKNGVKKV